MHRRPAHAAQLLLDLSDLFLAALAGPSAVSLDEELSLARRYLVIQAPRFGARPEVQWQVSATSAELQATMLPSLSVQPLVENAIKHGIEPGSRGGRISIEVDCSGPFATVTVRNPMPGGDSGTGKGPGSGLAAVRARIEHKDSFYFNWGLDIPLPFQQPFAPTHEAMAGLDLHHGRKPHELAADLRRAFSGIVAGNVKEDGMRRVEKHGPFQIHGAEDMMPALDDLLRAFVEKRRMTIAGE